MLHSKDLTPQWFAPGPPGYHSHIFSPKLQWLWYCFDHSCIDISKKTLFHRKKFRSLKNEVKRAKVSEKVKECSRAKTI